MATNACQFSPCRRYRYTLWRDWSDDLFLPRHSEFLMVIGLNPSTADESNDDPTIRRCIDFAKRWGFGRLLMTNLFAWRDTKPAAMKKAAEPIGAETDGILATYGRHAGMVLAAWGKHGQHLQRDQHVFVLLSVAGVKLHCLKRNKDGTPQHPLYIPAETQPFAFEWAIDPEDSEHTVTG